MTDRPFARIPQAPSGLRFVILALLAQAILFAAIAWIQHESAQGEELRQQVRESYSRRIEATELLAEINGAEGDQRGYVITGDRQFRQRYTAARDDVLRRAGKLAAAIDDDPIQASRIAALRETARAKFAEMDDVIRLRDTAGEERASERVREGLGKRLMMRIHAITGELIRAETTTGEERVAAFRLRTASIERSMWLLVATGSILLLAILYAYWRRRCQQHHSDLKAFESAERNETILDSTVDALLILNPSGTVETFNAAATRMLGYQPEDLVRRDIGVLTDIAPGSGSFSERIGLVDGALRNSWLTDRQVRHRDGQLIPVDIALGVMCLPDGPHIVASMRDISERKRIEKLKDEFISTVSHELRSPLTSIVGALRLLSGKAVGEIGGQAARLVEIAEENSRRLIRLINDMLDVDRMDSGKLRLALRQTDLREVVARGCQGNQGLAEAYHARIECEVPDRPLHALCDEDRLIQALTNLTSNALKVTPRGGTVEVGMIRDPARSQVVVWVDDRGPGVPAEFRERIFGRFERAASDEGKSGTGLGLAIAREIVSLHGGEIWFEDRPGGGTRFSFSIPALREARLAEDIAPEPMILILESDKPAANALRAVLADEGYDCRIADSAEAARQAIAQDGPGLLLADSSSAELNALSFVRDVRTPSGSDGLLLLAPSANADSLAALDWIEKPVDPQRLKAAIRAALGHGQSEPPVVLHLDDDNDTLDVTAAALKDDALILRTRTLEDARRLLRERSPDLAILDVHLSRGSGLELLPDLRDQDGAAIPAIIYSANDVSPHIAAGVDAVILKSANSLPDLKAAIRRIMIARHPMRRR